PGARHQAVRQDRDGGMIPVPRLPGRILRRPALPADGAVAQAKGTQRLGPRHPPARRRPHRLARPRSAAVMSPISRPMRRRHALKILAATAALPVGVLALRETQAQPAAVTWQGVSLGVPVGMTLW